MLPSIESDYKLLIITDVQRSIIAVNGVVVLLQGYQGPVTSSELIEKNYPQVTLGQFLAFSSTIVEVSYFVPTQPLGGNLLSHPPGPCSRVSVPRTPQ